MDDRAADCGALGETVSCLGRVNDLPDPRQRGKVTYPLDEVLLLALLAVLAGAETFVDIARFGSKKPAFLRRFRPFARLLNSSPPNRRPTGSSTPPSARTPRSTVITTASRPDHHHHRRRRMAPGAPPLARFECRRHGRKRPRKRRKIQQETRFYITSLVMLAHRLGPVARGHWAVENSLHWVIDMVVRDDDCRVRSDHAPANFTTVKHMAP